MPNTKKISRKQFVQTMSVGVSASLLTGPVFFQPFSKKRSKLLNAYYFRAHMYTLVPSQIRHDMKRMAEIGTDAVSVAILEQDLFAAVENVNIIAEEAHHQGMKLFVVPSRWGGMFAGAPKVPSIFSTQNPQTWILNKDRKPVHSSVSGVISSVHYHETFEFYTESIEKMMELWPVDGIIWDEPKNYRKDYSPKAVEKLGENASVTAHVQAASNFHSRVNAFIKDRWPEVTTNLFAYADLPDEYVEIIAKTEHLDYFGCDGRPWHHTDESKTESDKTLLGIGERYLAAARANEVKSLWLVENHNMAAEDIRLAKKRLPEVINHDVDQMIYYYYPRNLANPDENMDLIFNHMAKFKQM